MNWTLVVAGCPIGLGVKEVLLRSKEYLFNFIYYAVNTIKLFTADV